MGQCNGWGNVFQMEEHAQAVTGVDIFLTSFQTPHTFVLAHFVILAYGNIANFILLLVPCIMD